MVALFLGLSVSAEEINRDRSILQRERFLNLSRPCYIAAKSLYLFLVTSIQMGLYVGVGNALLEIPDMYPTMLLVLFSCGAVSCVLGLNISATLKSAVAIYILIPVLLVPQIMLGGAVIPLEELIHQQAGNRYTPFIADCMPSRWGYEALIVKQYTSNRYMKVFFDDDCTIKQLDYMLSFHLPEMNALAAFPFLEADIPDRASQIARKLTALENEIALLEQRTGSSSGMAANLFTPSAFTPEVERRTRAYLESVAEKFRAERKAAIKRKQETEDALRSELGRKGLSLLKSAHYNEGIAAIALQARGLEAVRLSGGRLVQVSLPICQAPESDWGRAHFLSARKRVASRPISTPVYNIIVLWVMAALLYLALYFSIFPSIPHSVESAAKRLRRGAKP